ncbi:MAG: VWA domain-containing protein [Acidobacteriota bacterium]|nr:VWA domain-containing protein [Acidobacteriota bacterium]
MTNPILGNRPFPPAAARTAALLCAGAMLLAAAADAQRGRRQNRAQFSDTTTVTVVEVPVQVSSGGDPLRGLTRDDFELLDGRRPVEITGFDMVDLEVVEGKVSDEPVPVAARRHFLLLFDLLFSTPDSVGRAQQAAADLVLRELHPTDLAAVALYDTRPRLVLGFTSDRSQLRQAISTLGQIETGKAVRDPLGLVIADLGGELPTGDSLGETADRAGLDADAMLARTRTELANLQDTANRDRAASDIAALSAGMSELAAWMGTVQGRKHVVFLSEGFDSSVLVGNRSLTSDEQDRMLELQQAAADGQSWRVNNEEIFGSTSAQRSINEMLARFREADCAIQSVDVSGEVLTEGQSNRDSLFLMSKDTGGEVFANFTDLGDAMSEMLQRTSVTYLLAFQPNDLTFDGKFRRLRVRLKNAPRGTRIVHRPGYYAPKPYAQTNPFERALTSAQQVMGGVEAGEIDAAVLTAGFAASSGKAYAPVLIEARGEDLLAGIDGGTVPLQIYAYALDGHGIVRDFFVRAMGLDAVQAGPALRQTGLKYWGHFDLDPGTYSVRVLVRNDATGRRALTTSLLEVPGEAATLQPPLFPEQPGKWVLLREEESEQRKDVGFPFLRSGEPFIPAARPEVTAGGETPISLVGSDLGAGPVSVRTQVFRANGEQVADGGEIVLAPGSQAGSGLSQLSGVFVAGKKLAAGDYTLSVVVTDQSNREHSSSTAIRVL